MLKAITVWQQICWWGTFGVLCYQHLTWNCFDHAMRRHRHHRSIIIVFYAGPFPFCIQWKDLIPSLELSLQAELHALGSNSTSACRGIKPFTAMVDHNSVRNVLYVRLWTCSYPFLVPQETIFLPGSVAMVMCQQNVTMVSNHFDKWFPAHVPHNWSSARPLKFNVQKIVGLAQNCRTPTCYKGVFDDKFNKLTETGWAQYQVQQEPYSQG